jgi:two-component system, NarL family, sensor histidine kinase UhpB
MMSNQRPEPAAAGTRRWAVAHRLLGVPLFYKILVANAVIVAAVAAALALLVGAAPPAELVLGVAAAGIVLTIALNAAIVRLALRPLAQLQATAERIRAGDSAARVPPSALADRDLRRLAATFNAILDADTEHRRRLRTIAVTALGAAEEERKRIARELHDVSAQELAALHIRLRVARNLADAEQRDHMLLELSEDLGRQINELRTMAGGLRPPALDMLGLGPAIEALARTLGEHGDVRVRARTEPVAGLLDATAELAIYRIVQEALANAAKHAGATQVDVELSRRNGALYASVHDDGRGFDLDAAMRHGAIGLFGMQERAAYIGGAVAIDSRPGAGTRVEISIPLGEAVS